MSKVFVHPDSIVPDKTYSLNGVMVKDYLIPNHNVNNLALPTRRVYPLMGITIHNTPTLGKDDDGKWYTASTINGNMGGVYVHYYCDSNSAWHNLPDNFMNWSCSDGISYAGGSAATIAIEVIMDGTKGNKNQQAFVNAAKLAAQLLYSNGLTANDLYTHSYWINTKIFGMTGSQDFLCTAKNARKNCPVYIIPQWATFKQLVNKYVVALGGKSIYDQPPVNSVNIIYRSVSSAAIRTAPSKSATILGRVTKGNYYPADAITNGWFKHAGQNAYSMLNDEGLLFIEDGNWVVKTTTAYVNVRSTPSITGDKLGLLSPGTKIYAFDTITIIKDGYNWQKIIYNGKVGYSVSEYMK